MNYELFLDRMNKEGALKSGYKKKSAYNKLWMLVNAKDAIAEMIWYLLTGALAISTTFNALLDIDCNIPTKRLTSSKILHKNNSVNRRNVILGKMTPF